MEPAPSRDFHPRQYRPGMELVGGDATIPRIQLGHSTQSAAWADVMTAMLGDGCRFTDHTHDDLGLPPRSFGSFRHAAQEAAVSRPFGGIHYRFGNENGLAAGICTGTATTQLPLRS